MNSPSVRPVEPKIDLILRAEIRLVAFADSVVSVSAFGSVGFPLLQAGRAIAVRIRRGKRIVNVR